jgi:Uncharacterized protein conserved in bacteria (DUF2188)
MAKGDIETYHEDGEWKNRPQGNDRASHVHGTKAEAEWAGERWHASARSNMSSRR